MGAVAPHLRFLGVPVGVVHDQAAGRHSTHVDDGVALLEREDLDEVVLCGHSYGACPSRGPHRARGGRVPAALPPPEGWVTDEEPAH
jgi:pimeloyl-ACP methyl ester carboxylesterase